MVRKKGGNKKNRTDYEKKKIIKKVNAPSIFSLNLSKILLNIIIIIIINYII